MRRETVQARRITLTRREPMVRCTFPTGDDGGMSNEYGSCGAMIPHRPRKPCPECGVKQLNATAPAPGPDSLMIDGDAIIIDADSGETVVVQATGYGSLANAIAAELRQVTTWDAPVTKRNTPANEGRLSGIIVCHRTFGYTNAVPLRRRYGCTRCRFDTEYPRAARLVDQMCECAESVFRRWAPEVHDSTTRRVRDTIPPAWLIAGTPWSSGIINHTAAMPYHVDKGNVEGSWSAMLTCRRGIEGGFLHLVDYDAYLTLPNGSISIFDGQSVLHGVTPFRLTGKHAYRYTLVTYAKQNMRACSPNPADEVKRAAIAATAAEDRRVRRA